MADEEKSLTPTALVLGGAGMVGSYLCDSLLSQSCQVLCLDKDEKWRQNNIDHLQGRSGFKFLKEIGNFEEEINYVFCLDKDYYDYVKRFSTSRWLVFSQKFEEDLFLRLQENQVNFRQVCARQYYGPRLNLLSEQFLPKLIRQSWQKKQVLVPGDGSATIYPLFVKDLVNGLTAACFWPQSRAQVFYLKGPETTVYSFAQLWGDIWPDLAINFSQEDYIKPLGYLREAEQSAGELGWEAKHSVLEGVTQTAEWLDRPDIKRIWGGILDQKEVEEKPVEKTEEKTVSEDESFTSEEESIMKTKPAKASIEAEAPASLFEKNAKDEEQAEKEEEEAAHQDQKEVDSDGLWLSRRVSPTSDTSGSSSPQTEVSSFLVSFEDEEDEADKEEESPAPVKRNGISWVRFLVVLLVSLLLLPIGLVGKDLVLAYRSTRQAQDVCLSGQLDQCLQASRAMEDNFSKARITFGKLTPVTSFLFGQKLSSDFNNYLFLGIRGGQALENFARAGQKMGQITAGVFAQKEIDRAELFFQLKQDLEQAYFDLSHVTAASRRVDLPASWENQLKNLTDSQENIQLALDSLPLLEGFLTKEQQKILLLLQNNMELRPTGGFIGSYALMDFRDGSLVDFSVHDVYEGDGQLKGQVQPPEWLKSYLGEDNWYLRDSNWSPDFPTAARQAMWFYEKEMKEKVDGVVALNLTAMKAILAQTGPLHLPDYDEDITAKNLFERAEYHSEVGFFPGSQEKKNFLASLSFELLEQVRQNNIPASALVYSLGDSLQRKNVLFYLSDADLEAKLMELGFDGGVKQASCKNLADGQSADNCYMDYLWVVDANVGANKANFFVNRAIAQRVTVLPDKIKHSLRLTWTNEAQTETWPGGKYKNFVRLYLPAGVQIKEVYLEEGGGNRAKKDWQERVAFGRKAIGLLVEVPIKSTRILEIRYDLPVSYQAGKKRLAYLIQKQGGTDWEKSLVLFSYPDNWLPAKVSPQTELSGKNITYQDLLEQDQLFNFAWGEAVAQ